MTTLQLVCMAVLMVGARATVVNHRQCSESRQDVCNVSQVRIDPCVNPNSCLLKRGTPASLSFDFTPNFSTSNLKTSLFWVNGIKDYPFDSMHEADACELTPCPVGSGNSQELKYNLNLSKLYPRGTFDLKWILKNADDESQICCFMAQIKLR